MSSSPTSMGTAGSICSSRTAVTTPSRGELEPNRIFLNRGTRFEEAALLGSRPDIARVIRARDVNGDGHPDVIVGTTYQSQSRLFSGAELRGSHRLTLAVEAREHWGPRAR